MRRTAGANEKGGNIMSGKIVKTYEHGKDGNGIFLGAYIYESEKPARPFTHETVTTFEPCLKVWIQFRHCAGPMVKTWEPCTMADVIEKAILSEIEEQYISPEAASIYEYIATGKNKEDARALKAVILKKQPELFDVQTG